MPNGLFNWNFKDVDRFLRKHHFEHVNTEGSHLYYRGRVDGEERLTFIPWHRGKSIPPKTLESTIHKSGIPKEFWKKWGNGDKDVFYGGARAWR